MSTAIAALLGLIVGAVGWMIVGHQRVTETIVEERRQAYVGLLVEADLAASNISADRTALRQAVTKAEFASSDQMRNSGRIQQVEKLIKDLHWHDERAKFITVARVESLHNAFLRRWWHRGWYEHDDRIERWLNARVSERGQP
jgi:hypothetical protein